MITREQCLKWAEEVELSLFSWQESHVEALCQRVWNEALQSAENQYSPDDTAQDFIEKIRNLKVTT